MLASSEGLAYWAGKEQKWGSRDALNQQFRRALKHEPQEVKDIIANLNEEPFWTIMSKICFMTGEIEHLQNEQKSAQ